ncbi:hypothetical protein CA265_17295 [Sphingobacteriaceae bacterium GW460-11-11-14-LB5]|nr:hypothetical protein CA265_17295 [Sphingobacteriaceae bacterium GW460-11-11-14-LB5]
MDAYIITKLLTKALMTALIDSTLLFFMIKGFVNPIFRWIYIFIPVLVLLALFTFLIYPLDIFQHPVFPLFQAFCFLGGISGAARYYWQRWNRKKQPQS